MTREDWLWVKCRSSHKSNQTHNQRSKTGGLCNKAATYYFAIYSTWRKIVVMQALFCGISVHRFFPGFARLFHTKLLHFESSRVAKSNFGIEILTLELVKVTYGISLTRYNSLIFVFV